MRLQLTHGQSNQINRMQDYTGCIHTGTLGIYIHPEMSKHLGLQYTLDGLSPLKNSKKYRQHCTLGTLVLRVHAPTHALSRPRFQIV